MGNANKYPETMERKIDPGIANVLNIKFDFGVMKYQLSI